MIKTYKDLKDQFLRYLDEAGDTGTTLALAGDLLNQAHQLRCTERNWPFMLWDTAETFSTVVNQQIYPLHQEFARPFYFYNRTAETDLIEVPARHLLTDGHLWNTDTGSAHHYVQWGQTQVKTQPSAASTLSLVSSSTTDATSTYAVTITGVNSSGVVVSESLTPSGTTAVTSSNTYTKILSLTKAAAWNGTLTVTSNSGAITNLTLLPSEYGRSYPQIFLLAKPDAVETIEYRFFRHPRLLSSDYDIPDIPPPYSQILVYDALVLYGAYDTGVNERHHAIWKLQATRWEDALIEAFLEGRTLSAKPRFVKEYQDEIGMPY